jgi:ATP:ADP antiporter, AAA family
MMKWKNPLKAIFDIRKSELPLALLMFSYFFLVITSFWILKPIKKSLFIEFYHQDGFSVNLDFLDRFDLGVDLDLFQWHLLAAQAELMAKVLNMGVAIVAVIIFTWLARRFRRQQLTFIFTLFFLLSYAAFSVVINQPQDITVWNFYLFGDLFSTLMVATFFAFLNDSVTPEAAKRLYGLIGLGGVTGGAFGSSFVSRRIADFNNEQWLWICFGLGVLILIVAYFAGRIVNRHPPPEPEPVKADAVLKSSAALEGARLVFRSPYLLSIVAIVGLYEIVSTIMDFQFSSTIAHYLEGPAIGQQFATVFAITNIGALLVQLFLTSFVMSHLGVGVALMVLPVALLGGSAAFMALPILWVGSSLNMVDNFFSYSINQSAKESLYVPVSKAEKYQAKAFIDMFVQRFAKAVAVAISLGITMTFKDFSSLRWLSLFTIVVIALWLYAAYYAGQRFKELSEKIK